MKVQKTSEVWLVKKRLPKPIDLVQYDTGIQIVFALQDFTIPGGTTATLYVQKPSGNFVYQETGITVSENSITIDLENQAITEHGNSIPYQVRLENGEDLITTFAGIFRVEKSIADSGAEESKTVISAFTAMTAEKIAEIEAATDEFILQAQAKVADKGLEVLNTIPADYTATAAMAEKAIREKGSAIVCEATGESITVADASGDHLRGLKLFGKTTQRTTTGKNLLPFSYKDLSSTENGVTTTVNSDGSISFSGTATGYAGIPLYEGNISIFPEVITIFALGSFNNVVLHIVLVDKNGSTLLETNVTDVSNFRTIDFSQYTDVERITINAKRYTTGSVSGTIYPLVVSGRVDYAEYEPYTGGIPSPNPDYPQELKNAGSSGNVVAKVMGANLFDVKNAIIREGNGLTCTINADGSVTVNGTPTGNYAQVCSGTIKLPKGRYFVSGGKNAAGCAYFQLYANKKDGSQKYAINGVFVVDGTESDDVHYSIQSGNFLDQIKNYTLFPMFNVGEVQKPFEPYNNCGTVAAQTPNGLPGIPVASGGNYTDENGQQWICDEIDFARGVYVQRVRTLDFSTFNWKATAYSNEVQKGYYAKVTGFYNSRENFFHTHYRWLGYEVGSGSGANAVGASQSAFNNRKIGEIGFCSKADGQDYFGVVVGIDDGTPVGTLQYVRAEPIETPLTADELAQYAALHTNKPETVVYNDAGSGMKIEYNADTKLYIDNKINMLVSAIVNNA